MINFSSCFNCKGDNIHETIHSKKYLYSTVPSSVMPACPASFLKERFPTSGNDTTCTIIYDALYSTQIISEVCVNLIKKIQFSEEDIQNPIASFYEKYTVVEISKEILLKASELRKQNSLSYWDSVVVASALVEEKYNHSFNLNECRRALFTFCCFQ